MHPAVVADPKNPDSCEITVKPVFAEDASWGVRIRALSAVSGSSSSSSSSVDLLQLSNASAVTRINKCTGARAPAELGGSMTAKVSSTPPAGGPPIALELQFTASNIPAKEGVRDIGCVDNSFAVGAAGWLAGVLVVLHHGAPVRRVNDNQLIHCLS
jgi:hypothetical protein